MKYIQDLKEGSSVNDIYLCRKKLSLVTKNGKAYESLTLQDKTGSVDAKIWDPGSAGIDEFDELDYINVIGDVTVFQGKLQLNVKRVRRCREGEYDPKDYLPVSDRSVDEMYEELLRLAGSVRDVHLHRLLEGRDRTARAARARWHDWCQRRGVQTVPGRRRRQISI